MVNRIVSGGQTGVDRAALDIAIELNIGCGGWCPKERWAEDGRIADKYPLIETATVEPCERTKLNVKDSDGTLIFIKSQSVGEGTQLTIDEALRLNKPLFIVDLSMPSDIREISQWLSDNNITMLNVAGPRESQNPGIYNDVCSWFRELLIFITKPSCKP